MASEDIRSPRASLQYRDIDRKAEFQIKGLESENAVLWVGAQEARPERTQS